MIKVNKFRGDLTNISAKKGALLLMSWYGLALDFQRQVCGGVSAATLQVMNVLPISFGSSSGMSAFGVHSLQRTGIRTR